jgi:hypothetical protein
MTDHWRPEDFLNPESCALRRQMHVLSVMNAKVHSVTNHQSMRPQVGTSLLVLAGVLIACASGCSSPVKGPTDPKEFIVQRRNWTTTEGTTTGATPAATESPAAAAPANGAPVTP